MKLRRAIAFSSLLFLLTGCWNRSELDEFSFVQAVSIDRGSQEGILLTVHFYKPSGGGGESSGNVQAQGSSFNIQTEGVNVFEAIRDITIHLGRKAKWDHMGVILISEKLAKQEKLNDLLDFFVRDHEPRPTTFIIMTKGNASEYLQMKPYIEHTMGRQLRLTDATSHQYSAKTIQATMMNVSIQLKSQTGIANLPYLFIDRKHLNQPSVAGIIVFKKGKVTDIIPSKEVKGFLMLTNQLSSGVINVDCSAEKGKEKLKHDAFEIISMNSKVKPSIKNGKIMVHVKTKIIGSDGEIRCHSVKTVKEEEAFEQLVSNEAKKEMEKVIEHLQEDKIDALGIGNKIFSSSPDMWKLWKEEWDERFANIQFTFDVSANVLTSGTKIGKPSSSK